MATPDAFGPPVYSRAGILPRFAMAFVLGGVFTLLGHALRARRQHRIALALAAAGAVPLIVPGALAMTRSGIWPAPLLGILLGAGAVVDAARPVPAGEGRWQTVPSIAVVAAVTALAHSLLALRWPALLRIPASAWLGGQRLPVAGVMLAAAAALGLGWAVPRVRSATQVAAAAALAAIAVGLVPLGRWLGVVTYGLLAVFLASEPALRAMMAQRIAERATEPTAVTGYELATEAAAWGFVSMIALAGSIETQREARQALAALTLVASVFTIYWFHFRSVRRAELIHTVTGSAAYSVLVAILVALTGGARSPYFFIYALPIVALAWTRSPQTVLVPLTIPLVALITESTLMLRSGQAIEFVLVVTIPRAGGLVLIAGFSYLLARRNLDEQRRARTQHLQLQAVLAHMGEGLMTVDARSIVTLCNGAAQALLGAQDEIVGRSLDDLLPLRRVDGGPLGWSDHPVRRALAGHRVPWERVMATRRDGPLPLAISATPLADGQGGSSAIVLLRDVRAEVEMERMRDDFFFIASHELRTPLTVMKGNLELAQEAAPEGPLRKTIAEALTSVLRLIRIVNDYLDAARLEHGTLTVRLEDGFMTDLVRQAVETIRPDAERKGLRISYREAPDLPAVRMDVERTLQILLNLLGNSVRYTTQGEIQVWHEVHDGMVETLVRDTGAGIPPEHHARLFTRFGQVERGLTRASGGSGLGLYISRKLAEQMGGSVVLKHSAPGQGSTFVLRLAAAR